MEDIVTSLVWKLIAFALLITVYYQMHFAFGMSRQVVIAQDKTVDAPFMTFVRVAF